ncbi:MAG: hypothetical protein P1S46_06140 [bacterium]|nr:hypothetical protein [bacterium]
MTIDFAGDLAQLVSTDDFAVLATYDGGQIPIIFDLVNEPIETNLGVVEALGPTAICRSADVEGIAHDDVFTIPVDGTRTRYKVVGIEPDGLGLTTLVLMETT